MRKCHFLKPNHSSETMQCALFFDTETDQLRVNGNTVKHVLRFGMGGYIRRRSGGVWTNPKWCKFVTVPEFYSFLETCTRDRTRLYVFCHNTNFDLPVIDVFGQMPAYGWELKTAIIQGPPTIITFKRDRRTVTFLDTLNFFRMSLKQLGQIVGLDKMDMPDNVENVTDFDAYCKRDVEVIMKAMQTWSDFLVDRDYGGFAHTISGQAMKLYRHRFMHHDIGIHDNEDALRLERQSYMGGRTEAHRIGKVKGTWYLLDVNSMYPYVMQKYEYPTKLRYYSNRKTIDDLSELLNDHLIIARVDLDTDLPAYALRHNNKLVFPIGTFTVTLCTPEIIYALENGHLKKLHEIAVYHKAPIFRDYVDTLYKIRCKLTESGDTVTASLYKQLLVSLYGKFGQKGLVYENVGLRPGIPSRNWIEYDLDAKVAISYRSIAGLVQRLSHEIESRDSFPGIASHVTAYARLYLWKIINGAGRENCAYCDTDSVLVSHLGRNRLLDLLDNRTLGALKEEGIFHNVVIHGCKDYVMDDKVRIKGVRKNAILLPSGRAVQEKWTSLLGQLRSGNMNAPETATITKRLKRIYDKGCVSSGGEVLPLVFSNGEYKCS